MNNKRRNLIFSVMLIAIVSVMGILIIKRGNDNNSENNTLSSEELAQLKEEECEEQNTLDAEREAYSNAFKEAGIEIHKGEYKNRSDSREVNADFIISDEYSFRQIFTYNEIEFLEYEELDDLSAYFSQIVWDGDNINEQEKNGFMDGVNYCIQDGLINKDGTLNTVTQIIRDRYSNWDIGEDNILENQEVVAVKLKIKYTNLSFKEQTIDLNLAHPIEDFVFLDDGKLYRKTSVYSVANAPFAYGAIYNSMNEKFQIEDNIIYPSIIVLEPREEYIGEVIYLFLKEDLDEAYFVMHSGLYGSDTIENFNAPGIRLLPLTELKKLEGK